MTAGLEISYRHMRYASQIQITCVKDKYKENNTHMILYKKTKIYNTDIIWGMSQTQPFQQLVSKTSRLLVAQYCRTYHIFPATTLLYTLTAVLNIITSNRK